MVGRLYLLIRAIYRYIIANPMSLIGDQRDINYKHHLCTEWIQTDSIAVQSVTNWTFSGGNLIWEYSM